MHRTSLQLRNKEESWRIQRISTARGRNFLFFFFCSLFLKMSKEWQKNKQMGSDGCNERKIKSQKKKKKLEHLKILRSAHGLAVTNQGRRMPTAPLKRRSLHNEPNQMRFRTNTRRGRCYLQFERTAAFSESMQDHVPEIGSKQARIVPTKAPPAECLTSCWRLLLSTVHCSAPVQCSSRSRTHSSFLQGRNAHLSASGPVIKSCWLVTCLPLGLC